MYGFGVASLVENEIEKTVENSMESGIKGSLYWFSLLRFHYTGLFEKIVPWAYYTMVYSFVMIAMAELGN